MNKDLIKYYHDRAKEYEKLYTKPERQEDLNEAAVILQDIFSNKTVLEIACGTGYWTERIAEVATSVLATDINASVIELAQQKQYSKGNVVLETADIYTYRPDKKHESLFGGFIWSHIPLKELDRFIETVNKFVLPGGIVVFIDNIYVEGSNHPITNTDEQGNTFQTRELEDGTTHMVLKNFPSKEFLEQKLNGFGTDVKIITLPYYWVLVYKTLNNG